MAACLIEVLLMLCISVRLLLGLVTSVLVCKAVGDLMVRSDGIVLTMYWKGVKFKGERERGLIAKWGLFTERISKLSKLSIRQFFTKISRNAQNLFVFPHCRGRGSLESLENL